MLSKRGEQGDSLNVNGELADGCDLRESTVDQGAVDGNERNNSTMESLPSRSTWFDIEEVREVGGRMDNGSRFPKVTDVEEVPSDCPCLWLALSLSALLQFSFPGSVTPARRNDT